MKQYPAITILKIGTRIKNQTVTRILNTKENGVMVEFTHKSGNVWTKSQADTEKLFNV